MVHQLKETNLLDSMFGTGNFIGMLANDVSKINDRNCDFGIGWLFRIVPVADYIFRSSDKYSRDFDNTNIHKAFDTSLGFIERL